MNTLYDMIPLNSHNINNLFVYAQSAFIIVKEIKKAQKTFS